MLSAKCLFAYVNTYICLLVFFYKILPLLFFCIQEVVIFAEIILV